MGRRRAPGRRGKAATPTGARRRPLRRLLPWAAAVLASVGTALVWRALPAPLRREAGLNVLLVTLDTLRADALGAYGQARRTSPLIDRLAREGVRFTAAHAHNTVTLPSHANILSGRLPPDHGVRDNSGFRFPTRIDTLATLLRARGYHTGAFVSSLTLDSRFGLDRGFDLYDDSFGRRQTHELDLPERAAQATVTLARDWLDGLGAGSWFCWVHLYDPHAPYAPPAPWREAFRDAPYLGEVAATDAALAPLLEPLLSTARSGRTFVVVTADHGEALGEHGERTHGLFAYEATLHVPLILYAPRLLRPRVVDAQARHVDLLPTVLDALALEAPKALAGRSLLPAANGHRVEATATYFEALSSMLTRRWAPLHGVVADGFKYVDLPLPELYDLKRDPHERHNLVAAAPGRLDALRSRLALLRGADASVAPLLEAAELRRRLAALGYLGTATPNGPAEYGPGDDPKHLVHLDALMQQAIDLRRAGDLSGACALARRVVQERPGMTAALVQLALVERELGDRAAAIATLEQAVASNPRDPNPVVLLATALDDAGVPEQGLELLTPWAHATEAPADVLTTHGMLLARLGRHGQALASFERAHAREPSAMTLVQIATVHLATGNREAARVTLEAALGADPRLAMAHRQLGLLALADGDDAEAERRFRAALEHDPSEADALLHLGRLLRAHGRMAEARSMLQRFLAAAPGDIYAAQARAVRAWLGSERGGAR